MTDSKNTTTPRVADHSESGSSWIEFLKQTFVTRYDVFFLGVNAVLSGQVTAWGSATGDGYWTLLASALLPSLGYVVLILCCAEMTSALPFSGGVYGTVRAFTTPLLGFVVAVFEIMLNVCYAGPIVYMLASLPSTYGPMPRSLILVNCLLIYVIILSMLLVGGRVFWSVNLVVGLYVLLLFVIYIFGSSSYADFSEWGTGEHYNSFEVYQFMKNIPLLSTCYVGIQLAPLSSRSVHKPKKDVPIVMCVLIGVCVCMNIATLTLASSQSPGIDGLSTTNYPLRFGLGRIFNMSAVSARWLNAPCLFATAFGFIFFCGRQLSCMAGSKLIPEVFQQVIPGLETPYVSLIAFALISFLLNIVTFYYEDAITIFYLVSSLSSFIVYILALIGYIRFHKRYSSLERFFASPFGVSGAYVGIVVFAFCFVGGVAFQPSFTAPIIIGVVAVLSVIYFIFFSGEQAFSEEEKEELFKAYLVNANLATKKRIQKRGQVTPLSQGSRTKVSDRSQSAALRSGIHSVSREVRDASVVEGRVGMEESVVADSGVLEDVLESGGNKENQVSSAMPVTAASSRSKEEGSNGNGAVISSELGRSVSERVKHYLSSKMNKILPDPASTPELQKLEILQAGGLFNDSVAEP